MFSLQIIFSTLLLAAVCFAGCLLNALRVSRRRIADLEDLAVDAEARIQSLESQSEAATQLNRSVTSQIDALLIRLARVEKGSGSMMITSSVGAFGPSTTLGTYNISKLADIALVRNLAAEYGQTPYNAAETPPDKDQRIRRVGQ